MRHPAPIAFTLLFSGAAQAQSVEEQDLALVYGDRSVVSIATGAPQALRRAPAVASVFTAEDIRAMGAADLIDVLSKVPGLNVSRTYVLYESKFQFRGGGTDFNQQVLVLINGLRRQIPFQGSPEDFWISMPVENIARVEVIRGPGSALYGADAFAGVISITTKNAADLGTGTQVGARVGSRSSAFATWQQGWRGEGWDAAAWLHGGRTKGGNETIDVDAQTAIDAALGTHASLAPGPVDARHKDFDGGVDLGWGNWRARFGLKQRRDMGDGAGLAHALAKGTTYNAWVANADLSYQVNEIAPNWSLQAQFGLDRHHINSYIVLFPPGAFGGLYPDGVIGTPGRDQRNMQLGVIASYTGWQGHKLRLGGGWQDNDMYRTWESKNFDFRVLPGVGLFPVPLGGVVDVSATGPYIDPRRRHLSYLLLQDEWSIARDWTLTAGLRHDRYSDFGATTNPRLALVWDAAYDLTFKLLHGQAFRAPSFQELYITNNPVTLGNPNLSPERMRTSEAVLDWQPSSRAQLVLSLFHYKMRDIIRYVPNADPLTGTHALNVGEQTGNGLEAEGRWQAGRDWQLRASWSYQRSIDGQSGQNAGYAPQRMLKLSVDGRLAPDWTLNVQARHIADRARSPGDTRPPVAEYTMADISLQWRRDGGSGWSLMAGLRNAFDADAREPSPAPGNIPHDFPLQRRNWVLAAQYGF